MDSKDEGETQREGSRILGGLLAGILRVLLEKKKPMGETRFKQEDNMGVMKKLSLSVASHDRIGLRPGIALSFFFPIAQANVLQKNTCLL